MNFEKFLRTLFLTEHISGGCFCNIFGQLPYITLRTKYLNISENVTGKSEFLSTKVILALNLGLRLGNFLNFILMSKKNSCLINLMNDCFKYLQI